MSACWRLFLDGPVDVVREDQFPDLLEELRCPGGERPSRQEDHPLGEGGPALLDLGVDVAAPFTDGDGYFDERGHSSEKTLLKTPLKFQRVSSGFDRKRMHPVLHTVRAHLGVDYAAPVGTPVWAAASGVITQRGIKAE